MSKMVNILDEILFIKQPYEFETITKKAKSFHVLYNGNSIIRDNIFLVLENYARKEKISLNILRYPFKDDELWVFSFLKEGNVFVCINLDLALNKQIFATAHELYHIYCYINEDNQTLLKSGSLLDSTTADEIGKTQEDLEANAFAGLLLIPELLLKEEIELFDIQCEKITLDDILILMDIFAVPFKAMILRLFECKLINKKQVYQFMRLDAQTILKRSQITGKAKRWMVEDNRISSFGNLEENLQFNIDNDLLLDSRLESDIEYLDKLKKEFDIKKV